MTTMSPAAAAPITSRIAGEHRGLRRLRVEQALDLEATGAELVGPVVRVVHAAGQVHVGARIVVDADAKRFLGHGLVS
jgi:hypothetical protein